MGKDELAISVSGYVYRGEVKYTDQALRLRILSEWLRRDGICQSSNRDITKRTQSACSFGPKRESLPKFTGDG